MSWTIVVVVLAIAVVVSPILNLVPSQSQRQIARLRAQAINRGLRIRLVELAIAGIDQKRSLAVYTLPFEAKEITVLEVTPWQLIRGNLDHDIHFFSQWDWADSDKKADQRWQTALLKLFEEIEMDDLFERFFVLELTSQGVQVYWQEGSSELEDLIRVETFLQRLKAFALQRSNELNWPE